MAVITPRNRNDGTSVQKARPKSGVRSGERGGEPHPRRRGHQAGVEDAERRGHAAADDDAGDRAPEPQDGRTAQGERGAATTIVASAASEAASGSTRVASSSSANTTEARVMERIIITRAADDGGDDAPQDEQPAGDGEPAPAPRRSPASPGVAGPPSVTAVMQKGIENAAVNMGSTAPAPDGAEAAHLDQRRQADHDQGGEDYPEQVGVAPPGRVGDDHGRHQQRGPTR